MMPSSSSDGGTYAAAGASAAVCLFIDAARAGPMPGMEPSTLWSAAAMSALVR